jgi:hypothetical protein
VLFPVWGLELRERSMCSSLNRSLRPQATMARKARSESKLMGYRRCREFSVVAF